MSARCRKNSYLSLCLSICLSVSWFIVLQKKRMRRAADWSHAGGPIEILKACQEITAGRGEHLSAHTILHTHHEAVIIDVLVS